MTIHPNKGYFELEDQAIRDSWTQTQDPKLIEILDTFPAVGAAPESPPYSPGPVLDTPGTKETPEPDPLLDDFKSEVQSIFNELSLSSPTGPSPKPSQAYMWSPFLGPPLTRKPEPEPVKEPVLLIPTPVTPPKPATSPVADLLGDF